VLLNFSWSLKSVLVINHLRVKNKLKSDHAKTAYAIQGLKISDMHTGIQLLFELYWEGIFGMSKIVFNKSA
jgi:hypothetical protein